MEINTASIKEFTDVEFQDVVYTVKLWKNYAQYIGTRKILQGVSGRFPHGELTAIIGSSGAGKSSLLNALSGYVKKNECKKIIRKKLLPFQVITTAQLGYIKIDHKSACYITQDDHHPTLLTVEELMNYASDLKLNSQQHQRKQQIVSDILTNLHLDHRRNVKPHKLSGGEKKRLSIALELIANPKTLFLDEPTSGLDEVTASQCIKLLSRLAQQGHTVVCTIHQASASLFNYFDLVYIMGKGRCVYQGSPKLLLSFLQYIQRECPKYYSPADYILELCEFEEDKMVPLLSDLTENGKLVFTNTDVDKQQYFEQTLIDSTALMKHKVSHQFPTQAPQLQFNAANSAKHCMEKYTQIVFNRVKSLKKHYGARPPTQRPTLTSTFYQFYVILKMMMLKLMRSRIPILLQFLHHGGVGLFVGLIFLKLGNEGSHMFAHLKFCMSSILIITYTQIIIPVLAYPAEVKTLKKEIFNKWYTLPPYYAALCISRIPLQLIYNALYMGLVYWMTGFPMQWWRFSMVVMTAQMTSFLAEGAGLFLGSIFNIINGAIVGPLIISIYIGLGIYGFDFMPRIPTWLEFALSFSFMRVGCKALILAIFGYDRKPLHCNDIFCYFSNPRALLKFLNLKDSTFNGQMSALMAMAIFFRVALYLALFRRCKT